jgi:hypothetical protein
MSTLLNKYGYMLLSGPKKPGVGKKNEQQEH